MIVLVVFMIVLEYVMELQYKIVLVRVLVQQLMMTAVYVVEIILHALIVQEHQMVMHGKVIADA